jgi:hypothetical protein
MIKFKKLASYGVACMAHAYVTYNLQAQNKNAAVGDHHQTKTGCVAAAE